MTVAFTLGLLAVVLIYIGYPLLRPGTATASAPPPADAERRARLRVEHDNALESLADLDFEHAVGRVSDTDYVTLRAARRDAAMATLYELEQMSAAPRLRPTPAAIERGGRDETLEQKIAHKRQRLAARAGTGPARTGTRDEQGEQERVTP